MIIVLRDGGSIEARGYRVREETVSCETDSGPRELGLDEVDLRETFLANSRPADAAAARPGLVLDGHTQAARGDYLLVEGLVRNPGPAECWDLVAQVIVEDEGGRFLGAEEALVTTNPLGPGGQAPFRVVLRGIDAPHRRARVRFRTVAGELLDTQERG